jgi:hypothetical protein
MSPLLGGEFVIAFLGLRIALWIWRSRGQLAALAHDDGPGGPDGGGRRLPPPVLPRARPALRLVPSPARPAELRRAA